jgi:hypothetical protein
MARAVRAVIDRGRPPAFIGGVELFFVRGKLTSLPDSGRAETEHSLTMLVTMSDESAGTHVVHLGCFALTGLQVEYEVLNMRTWRHELRGRLRACPPGRINLVLLLPRFGASTLKTARGLLGEIRNSSLHTVGVAVALAECPADWVDLRAVDGFVKSAEASMSSDATAMFALLLTFTAPTLLTCSIDMDVADALGDAMQPSRVAIAIWDFEEQALRLHAAHDRHAVATSEAISLSPLWFQGTWRASHELMRQLRLLAPKRGSYIYNVSTNFFCQRYSLVADQFAPVVMLCKPAPARRC